MTLLYEDDRATLTEDTPQRYALGDPQAPTLVLNAVDGHGVMWVCEEPVGWDAPTFDTPLDRRQDGDGAYAGEPTLDARVLSFTGSAQAPTVAEALRARARLLNAMQTRTSTLYTHLDDAPAKSLWMLPEGKPRVAVDGRWLDYAFVLVADDPLKIGDEVTVGPTRLPSGQAQPGLTTPLTNPLTITGGALAEAAVTVPNDGDEGLYAHALYEITGPVSQPRVEVAAGEFIGLLLDLGPADVARIDTDAGTVTVNGVLRYDAWAAGSTFPMIPPGGTTVRLRSATGDTSQAAGLTVTTAPRYR